MPMVSVPTRAWGSPGCTGPARAVAVRVGTVAVHVSASWAPGDLRRGPRARHLTREHVCQGYVLAGYPTISRVKFGSSVNGVIPTLFGWADTSRDVKSMRRPPSRAARTPTMRGDTPLATDHVGQRAFEGTGKGRRPADGATDQPESDRSAGGAPGGRGAQTRRTSTPAARSASTCSGSAASSVMSSSISLVRQMRAKAASPSLV